MRQRLRKALYILVPFFLVIQLFQPTKTNPTTDPARTIQAAFSMQPTVTSALARACNDCHTNQTSWPWYSPVAPISWLVASDVNRGRKALNFSDWKSLNADKQQEMLPEICKEVSEREMPTEEYILMHPRAKLTSNEVKAICSWVHSPALHRLQMAKNK
jgi:hypothetical protein